MNRHLLFVVLVASLAAGAAAAPDSPDSRQRAATIVAGIQRADYEGDRASLRRLYGELKQLPATDEPRFASRLRYWQGFALWRRALNGFSDSAVPEDLTRDLEQAVVEFEEALRLDGQFTDAKVGMLSCIGNLAAMRRNDPVRVKEALPRIMQLATETLAAAPENPRVYWALGPVRWWTPPEHGGGQDAAFAIYEKGLQLARRQRGARTDALEPSWGEPELLMSLAWSSLNKATPDAGVAQTYAREALRLVPHWRYVKRVLLPQIEQAKKKGAPRSEPVQRSK